ncbi:MAG: signal peptidase II [Finegoldia sp.]|nr:signal peptidase II [Finegoldia sp.]
MLSVVTSILVILLDQLTKNMAISLKNNEIVIIDNFLKFTYLENRGAAFGILQEKRIILIIFTILVIGVISIFLFKNYKEISTLGRIFFGLLIGGALGNFIDRFLNGYVVDYISVTFPNGYQFPIFNLADICVVISCIGLAIILIKGDKVDS